MKRLIRFVALFGLGLLALVIALGPGRLLRRTSEPTIAATDHESTRTPIQIADPERKGRSIGIALEGAGRIPIWGERTLEDGSTLQEKEALLAYEWPEPFADGMHLHKPVIELLSSASGAESPAARLRAGGADLAFHGGGEAEALLQQLRLEDLRAFTFSPDAVLELLEDGAVAMTLETERLESIDARFDSPEPAAGATLLDRLRAPGPVHLWRSDGTFDLRAGGMALDRSRGELTFEPPLSIRGTQLELPAIASRSGRDAARAEASARAAPRPPRPPFTLTADGVATFVQKGDAASDPSRTPAAADLGRVFGPGDLVFTRNVFLAQEPAPGTSAEAPWLRAERVALAVGRDAAGELTLERFTAETPGGTVVLGLLGGTAHARAVRSEAGTEALVLEGPVEAADLRLGEGPDAKRLKLSARKRLVARRLAADATLPERIEVTLEEDAHAEIAGELIADAAKLVALLQPPQEGASGGAKLLEVELFGGAAPATATFGRSGSARASETIRLAEDGAGGRTIHLRGAARAETAGGFVTGEIIDGVLPADFSQSKPVRDGTLPAEPAQPMRVIVPELSGGEVLLAGGGPFDAAGAAGAAGADRERLVVLEPLASCRLERTGDRVELRGRCRLRVREPGSTADLQLLECDELRLVPLEDGSFDARAAGDVVLRDLDPRRRLGVRADLARTERGDAGARLLVLEGAPASVTFTVPGRAEGDASLGEVEVRAARITRDLERGELVALGADAAAPALALVPEALLAGLLPSVRSGPVSERAAAPDPGTSELAPAELRAARLVLVPGGPDPMALAGVRDGTVRASERVVVTRPSQGASVHCHELALDLARRTARLDGGPRAAASGRAEPVVIRQPRPYDPKRVESITADWIEVRDGGGAIDAAPRAVFVFHPERAAAPGEVPPLVRVELRATDGPQLRGSRLALTGGVECDVEHEDRGDAGEPTLARGSIRSERLELLLSRGLDETEPDPATGRARPLEPIAINASQRVRLDYETVHAEGALLHVSFTGGATPSLELKEGVQPARLLAQDEAGDWYSTARFRKLKILAQAEPPARSRRIDERLAFEGLELVVERPRDR